MLTCATSLHCRSKDPQLERERDAMCVWLSNHHKEAWRNVWNLLFFSLVAFQAFREMIFVEEKKNLAEQVSTGFYAFQPDRVVIWKLEKGMLHYARVHFTNSTRLSTQLIFKTLKRHKQQQHRPVVKRSTQKCLRKIASSSSCYFNYHKNMFYLNQVKSCGLLLLSSCFVSKSERNESFFSRFDYNNKKTTRKPPKRKQKLVFLTNLS